MLGSQQVLVYLDFCEGHLHPRGRLEQIHTEIVAVDDDVIPDSPLKEYVHGNHDVNIQTKGLVYGGNILDIGHRKSLYDPFPDGVSLDF